MSFLHLIWGLKIHAVFDVWSIEHLLSGISFGSAVKKRIIKFLENFWVEEIIISIPIILVLWGLRPWPIYGKRLNTI